MWSGEESVKENLPKLSSSWGTCRQAQGSATWVATSEVAYCGEEIYSTILIQHVTKEINKRVTTSSRWRDNSQRRLLFDLNLKKKCYNFGTGKLPYLYTHTHSHTQWRFLVSSGWLEAGPSPSSWLSNQLNPLQGETGKWLDCLFVCLSLVNGWRMSSCAHSTQLLSLPKPWNAPPIGYSLEIWGQ